MQVNAPTTHVAFSVLPKSNIPQIKIFILPQGDRQWNGMLMQ